MVSLLQLDVTGSGAGIGSANALRLLRVSMPYRRYSTRNRILEVTIHSPAPPTTQPPLMAVLVGLAWLRGAMFDDGRRRRDGHVGRKCGRTGEQRQSRENKLPHHPAPFAIDLKRSSSFLSVKSTSVPAAGDGIEFESSNK
jgi:hypothetical protein